MAKNTHIPYGFGTDEHNAEDDPWTKLATINEYLEAGEAIPSDLARWLGGAIAYANEDKAEFLRRLGLEKPKGANVLGRRVCELEDQGFKREEALAKVMAESDNGVDDEKLSRSKLQRLRNDYLTDKQDAVQVWIENE